MNTRLNARSALLIILVIFTSEFSFVHAQEPIEVIGYRLGMTFQEALSLGQRAPLGPSYGHDWITFDFDPRFDSTSIQCLYFSNDSTVCECNSIAHGELDFQGDTLVEIRLYFYYLGNFTSRRQFFQQSSQLLQLLISQYGSPTEGPKELVYPKDLPIARKVFQYVSTVAKWDKVEYRIDFMTIFRFGDYTLGSYIAWSKK